jgi:adenine-specific DNA-methyltransferase
MSEALATSPATPAFQKLVAKLREVFQIDQPDLDFGIYRIINARAAEIGDYLENQLRAKVDASLATGQQAGLADLQRDLAAAEQQLRDLGVNPDGSPKVKDLRARVAVLSGGTSGHRDAVFSHLLTFFSRYYDRGDFISQRRYKGDTYAIPYSGEEVVLHWANKDQYYTKSGENFSNYTFSLADGRRVHFRLASADTAKDDRKDTDLERRFRLIAPRTVTRAGDDGEEVQEQQVPIVEITAAPAAEGRPATPAELILWFEYVPLPKKGDSQDTLNTRARDAVLADAAVKARWLDLAQRKPTEKNPQRTLLDKQLEDYTEKNKADYFIHKDLGGFLRRELDFYIKNEVMHLDDVANAASFADIEKSLRLIQCLRAIALDLVAFLAQLEDFQKKLWLKKKFVVEAHYCLMLNVESQASLLSVKDFKKPFDYKLRIATDSAGACQTRAVDLVETFNYLLGLRVAHLDANLDLGYILVSGKLPDGQSCLVVWRDCEKLDYEATSKLLDRHKITPNDNEYDVVYINGDHNIPTIAQATEAEGGVTRQLTLRQIEPEFIARMFAGEEL